MHRGQSFLYAPAAGGEHCGYGDLCKTVGGFGRTIVVRALIALQQFRADFDTEFVTAAMTAVASSMQFALPNRTPLPATREAQFSTNRGGTFRGFEGSGSVPWPVSSNRWLGLHSE